MGELTWISDIQKAPLFTLWRKLVLLSKKRCTIQQPICTDLILNTILLGWFCPSITLSPHKTRFCHFWKSLGGHTNSGPICQLLECASTKTLLRFKCIALCATGHSVFCKYLTIPLNRREQNTLVHLFNFKMLSSLVGSSWNELFIQTD